MTIITIKETGKVIEIYGETGTYLEQQEVAGVVEDEVGTIKSFFEAFHAYYEATTEKVEERETFTILKCEHLTEEQEEKVMAAKRQREIKEENDRKAHEEDLKWYERLRERENLMMNECGDKKEGI